MTLTIAGLVTIAFGVAWLARAVPILREARAARSWMATTGTILCRDTRRSGRGTDAAIVPVIRYRYTVDGIAYESERITVADEGFNSWKAAEQVLNRYASNTVEVRFNPARPAQAVLSLALPSYMSTVVGVGVVLMMMGAGIILFGER